MKKYFYLLSIGLLLVSCTNKKQSSNQNHPIPEGYEIVFEDEFDGETLNEEYWNYMLGDGSSYNNPGWGNNDAQYYQKENLYLKDGKLIIQAKKETVEGKNYTSARISTANKVHTKYGRIEAMIALPAIQGMWPAFWMLPESDTPYGSWASSGEIDIMEARGRVKDMTSAALHYGAIGSSTYQTRSHIIRDNNDSIEKFHIYALEWEELEMRWYVDDELFFTMDNHETTRGPKWFSMADEDSLTAPFDWDFHILLNMAVGGNFDGNILPPDDFTEAKMQVEYVRIYHKIEED